MNSFLYRHRVLSLLIVIIGIALMVLAAWMITAGPVTVARIVRYGDTDIDDFSHYPGRELVASRTPYVFEVSDTPLNVSDAALQHFPSGKDLETIVATHDSIAFLVIHDDTIAFERYFHGHTASSLSQAFSMSKSVFSALVGMAIEDGYLHGVDQPITDFVPELAARGFAAVTIRHLLTMTSGSNYVENDNPFGEHVIMNYTPALEAQILTVELEDTPGARFRYKSGDNALLALALNRSLSNESITAYMQRRVWTPLGMEHRGVWTIDHEGDGLEKTWCCLAASARDLAKIGGLFLNQGRWNGEQLVAAEWVAESAGRKQIPDSAWPADYRAAGWRGYGYQWWLASEQDGDYFAFGKDGQFLYVNPRRGVIIVRLGWSSGGLSSSEWIGLFQTIAAEFQRQSRD
ncbi:MAG: beta-lactamase family protein [Gammaproteobacteria bacterium]|nr:beta-lactamase family protein [Gammaproteobacteria bacterium]